MNAASRLARTRQIIARRMWLARVPVIAAQLAAMRARA